MTQIPASSAVVRALKHSLATAADSQIVRIVGLVDDLDNRQDAEELLAPIRARLRPLRPERPLRFSRLMFTPLQAVLVEPAGWRPSSVTLPRSAIKPLCAALGPCAELMATIQAMTAGATTRDADRIGEAGAILWPAAAAALRAVRTTPPEWRAAGLPEASFAPMAQAVAACLAIAPRLEELGDPTLAMSQLDHMLGSMLRVAAQSGPTSWGMMLALLVCTVPHAQVPRNALLNQGATAAFRPAASAALQHVWTWIEEAAEGSPLDLNEAGTALRQRATLLQAFGAERACRLQAAELQTKLRTIYLHHLEDACRLRIMDPLAALTAAPDDAEMTRLEYEARGLRRLALEIRGLGGSPDTDTVMLATARVAGENGVLAAIDRARLVEILDDTAAAVKVLVAQVQ